MVAGESMRANDPAGLVKRIEAQGGELRIDCGVLFCKFAAASGVSKAEIYRHRREVAKLLVSRNNLRAWEPLSARVQ